MARKTTKTCDICGRETERIVGKLHFIPVTPNGTRQLAHSNYSHHADVGECCKGKLFKAFKFQERTSFSEYMERRKVR